MSAAYASIAVALITAIGGILVAIIQKFRKENKTDHHMVRDILVTLKDDINNVSEKIDEHIQWHLKDR